MLKRVWSIAVAIALVLTMVGIVYAEGTVEQAEDATVQLNNDASNEEVLELVEDAPMLYASSAPSLSVSTSLPQVGLGGEFVTTVMVNNYAGGWASMAVDLSYDVTKATIVDIDYAESQEIFGVEPVIEKDESGSAEAPLRVVWISADGENVEADASFIALKVTFKALALADATPIQAEFMAGGMATYDDSGKAVALTSGTDYDATVAEKTIDIVKAVANLEITADKTVIKQGDKITVDVKLKDFYGKWAVLSLRGTFDPEAFTIEDTQADIVNTGAFKGEFMAEYRPNKSNPLAVCWFNTEDVGMASPDEVVMKVTLTAKKGLALDAGEYPISFSFTPDGNICMEHSETEAITEAEGFYKESSNEITVTVYRSPYLTLSADKTLVSQGGKVTVKVTLNNFRDEWAVLSLRGTFDDSVFTIADPENDIKSTGKFHGEFMAEYREGKENPVAVCWFDTEDAGMANPTEEILEVTLTARKDAELTQDQYPIAFSFVPDGNICLSHSSTEPITAEEGFFEPASEELMISVAGLPYFTLTPDKTEVKQGEYVTFTVTLNDFNIPWAVLAMRATFDPEVFSIETMSTDVVNLGAFPGEFMAEYRPTKSNPLAVCWFNTEDVKMAEKSGDIMTFKLLANKGIKLDQETYPVSVSFVPEGNICNAVSPTTPLTTDSYKESSEIIQIAVEEVNTVSVNIKWNTMEFTYSYGTWNTSSHQWEGSGWVCDTDTNKIVLTNMGQVDVDISFAYESDYTGMSGAFSAMNEEDVLEEIAGAVNIPKGATEEETPAESVWFTLKGLPEDTDPWGDTAQKVGKIILTIEEASGE